MTNTKSLRGLRSPLSLLVLCAIAACGGGDSDSVALLPPIGKRVIYIADTNGSDNSFSGDEVWVADTGSTTQSVKRIDGGLTVAQYADYPFVIGSGSAAHLGFRVVGDELDNCPSRLVLVPTTGGARVRYDLGCMHEVESASTTGMFAIRATIGDSPSALPTIFTAQTSNSTTVFQVGPVPAIPPTTVNSFHISSDGSTLAYLADDGLWAAPMATVGVVSVQVNTDLPLSMLLTPNGSAAIYVKPGETQYRLVPLNGGAPTLLTNALGGGDSLDDIAKLSPDGTQLLYVAAIGGERQLWLVALGAPLGEQRVDSAASLLIQNASRFAFSPDSARFVWTGDPTGLPFVIGASDGRLFGATVAAPTTTIALTPSATEEVRSELLWTDSDTIAYVSIGLDLPLPSAATALRTVRFSAPQATVVLSPDEAAGYNLPKFVACGDGTLVYQLTKIVNGVYETQLRRVTPMDGGNSVQITPMLSMPAQEIHEFVCVD